MSYIEIKETKRALDKQVGGSHYKDYVIQPYEFFLVNKIPYHKAAIIKRILRYDHHTGGGLEDLRKIKHEVDLIIELENSNSTWSCPYCGVKEGEFHKDDCHTLISGGRKA